jgi:DNA polymerase I
MKPFILVDGSSYLFRAYHAMPELMNSKGVPTGAAYGVINMLKRLASDYDSEQVVVVFDPKGKTTRHGYYPDYKANRPPMPDDLRVQIQPLHEIIRALGFPLVIQAGVEADDLIGTLAVRIAKKGFDVVISTGDKDMAQLVNKQVTLINTMSKTTLDVAGVKEKFGVAPEQIIDYLALMGDTVDNVPGVPKVGPKTAVKWLDKYQSLDNIIAHADAFSGKVGQYLRDSIPMLPMSKRLVTIDCAIPVEEDLSALKMKAADTERLKVLFGDLEFKSWLNELSTNGSTATTKEAPVTEKKDYECILNKARWSEIITKLRHERVFAFDTETTSINPMEARIVGLSLGFQDGLAVYVPLAHDYLGAPAQLDKKEVLESLRPFLTSREKTVVGQNLKYDYKILAHEGLLIKANMQDTMLESYVLNPVAARHDMDTLALNVLGKTTIHFEDIAGKGKKQLTFNEIDLEQATPYAAEDADITLQLHEKMHAQLSDDAAHLSVFDSIEMPLMPILANMEFTGVLLDSNLLHKQSAVLATRIDVLQKNIFEAAGEPFNIDSPKQMQAILYDKLNLPILKKTPKGQPSTAEPVLTELAQNHELPRAILEYRSLAKLKSTYTDKLPLEVNEKTGRVHTSYRQAATSTGRLASNNPNLQNIPVRSEEGRAIRKAFVVPEGYTMLSADYSQVELRIMAHLSQDKGLCDAFSKGQDVHKATAAEVFGVPLEAVTADQRRSAKAINFGLIYGMSAFGLAKQLGIDRASAQKYMDVYFSRYPGVKRYMEKTRELAKAQGYVSTIFGRKIIVPEINATNKMRQMGAERAAINAPMQGSAADIIKLAMIKVDAWLKENTLGARMLLQVHDELIFEVPTEKLGALKAGVKACMESACDLEVPLVVDVGCGANWEEAH